jgi:hypothetical protein
MASLCRNFPRSPQSRSVLDCGSPLPLFPEPSGLTALVLLLGLTLLIRPVLAELPSARLLTIFPAGGKAGSTVEVTVTGRDLDESKRIWASHPGISAVLKSPNTFTVRIGADVPPGTYDLCVIGKFGVSNPRAFA